MSKSISIPQALNDLKRNSLRRLSSARNNRKSIPNTITTTPLSGFVILVEKEEDDVRLYGTAAERAGLSVGDEIVGVNDIQIEGKKYQEVLDHIQECIRKKIIQLKVRRKALEIPAENEASVFNCVSSNRLITDAYLVSVDKDHIKEVTKRLKKEYPQVNIYDMEHIAASSAPPPLPPTTAPRNISTTNNNGTGGIERGTLRRPPEAFEMQEKKRKEHENQFLRSSLRKSKKLQALAKNVAESSIKEPKVTSFANPVAEIASKDPRGTLKTRVETTKTGSTCISISDEPKIDKNRDSELDEVIISVERIASKLSSLNGHENDVAIFRDFFAAPPIQAAIEQTVKSNGGNRGSSNCGGTTSSGIGTDSGGETSSCTSSSPVPLIDDVTKDVTSSTSSTNVNVKVVSVVKHEDSYLGATVRSEDNKIVVGRVVKGGIVEKMNLFQEGDELLELNGVSLKGKQVNEICDILRNLSGEVNFVVATKEKNENDDETRIVNRSKVQHVQHLRALFDYDPEDDVYVPCKELAMKFQRGDILHVLNTSDENWWQAYREGEDISHSLAGLIPSSSFRQQVVIYADEVEKDQESKRKELRKKNKKKGEVKKSADEENLPSISIYSDLLTYEEVVLQLPKASHRRPIVLCGAEGVGCLKLRDRLLESDRITLACPVPYTSRSAKEGEFNGVHYHFVTKQKFNEEAKLGKFVEYGEYQKNWYGTSKKDVINVIQRGKTCVMTLKPESLGAIRCPEVQPFIIFIAAPSLHVLRRQREFEGTFGTKDDELKTILTQSKTIEQKFGHLFDGILVNIDFDKSLTELKRMLTKVNTEPTWVPASWTS